MRKFSYWLTGIIIFCVVIILIVLLSNQQAISFSVANNAELSATIADDGGVDTTSSFQINFDEKVSAAKVRKYLTVSPEIELGIHQGSSSNQVLIVPVEPLDEDTVYRFTLTTDDSSVEWAIQTKGDLVVSSSKPSDKLTGISVNSSIDVYLNYGITLDIEQLNNYYSVTPSVTGSFIQNGRCLSFQPAQQLVPGQVYTVKLKKGAPTVGSSLTLSKSYQFAFETANIDGTALVSDWNIASGSQPFSIGQLPDFSFSSDKQFLGKLDLTIYSYVNATEYAEALINNAKNTPYWSFGGQHCTKAAIDGLQSVLSESVSVNEDVFTLTQALPAGWYLLKAQRRGENRYIYFQVSNISTYWQTDDSSMLVWAHDVAGKPAEGLTVSSVSDSGNATKTDADGLAVIKQNYDAPAAFCVSGNNSKLILFDNGSKQDTESKTANNWRYLYLDSSCYQSDDTLKFWGMLLPKDGSKLEYKRVSVIVIDENGNHSELLHEYAPLENNIFFGSVVLPSLAEGSYQLQIWQSGKQLVSRSFCVGNQGAALKTEDIDDAETDLAQLVLDKNLYSIDQNVTASLQGVSGSTLFISDADGIKGAKVNDTPVYTSKFKADELPGYYLSAVAYSNGEYYSSAYQYVGVDSSDYLLDIDISTDKSVYQSGDKANIKISASGKNLPKQLYAIICVGDQLSGDTTNIADAIYSETLPIGLNGNAETSGAADQTANTNNSNNQIFKQITIKEGTAKTDFIVEGGGNKVITVKCIGFGPEIVAGEATNTISVNQPLTTTIDVDDYYRIGDKPSLSIMMSGVEDPKSVEYTLKVNSINSSQKTGFSESDSSFKLPLGKLAKGKYSINLIANTDDQEFISSAEFSVFDQSQDAANQASLINLDENQLQIDEDTQLALLSSFERCRTLQTLWLSSGILLEDAASRFAAAHADILLKEYGGSYFENSLKVDQDLLDYQTQSGGISSSPGGEPELKLSALVAAIGNDSISNQALIDYFEGIINSKSSREQKLIALAGLSTLGEGVLNELQLYYKDDDTLSVNEQLWLAWGLVGCGDNHNAKNCLTLIDDKELDNGELAIMAEMVAAYCAPINQYSEKIDQMEQYSDFTEEISSDGQTYALERVLAARGIFPRLNSGEGRCKYQFDSTCDIVNLNIGGDLLLPLSSTAQTASFSEINGDICLLLLSSRIY